MTARGIIRITPFLAAVTLLSAQFSGADVIRLKNDREIEGKIVKETRDKVVLDIGGGEAVFYKKDIKAVERTEIVDTRMKHRAELEAKAEKMNALYYSILENDVTGVEFVLKSSAAKSAIDEIRKDDYSDTADRLENMAITGSYDAEYDRLYTSVSDMPYLEAKGHRDALEKAINADRAAAEYFWRLYKPYVTKLINTEQDAVKSVTTEKGITTVETFNEERVEKKLVFNEKNELQSIEGLDGLNKSKIKESAKFEQYESKYLANSIRSETQKLEAPKPATPPDPEKEKEEKKKLLREGKKPEVKLPPPVVTKAEIEYQAVDGVKWPKTVKFSFENADPALSLPASGTIEFTDVKVRFNRN